MDLHTIKSASGARRPRRRVGRGRASGWGKTSTKGHKGQMARSGHKHKATFEGGQMPLVRRMPKRGFTNVNEVVFIPINVSMLERFEAGTEVTVERLRSARLVRGPKAPVKILGKGDLSNKLIVKAQAFSESARRKIEAAGGVCEVVS